MVNTFEDFLQKIANSSGKLEIINYFQQNPSAIDSSQGLGRWINVNPFDIESDLDDLVEKGILLKENGGTHTLYRYSPPDEYSVFITNLFKARSIYEKKIAELEKEKMSISDAFSREIIREKGKTKTIIENMNEGILVLNKESKVLTINSMAVKILSIKDNNLSGKSIFSLIDPSEKRDIVKLITEKENGNYEIKAEEKKKDVFYKISISELRDDSLDNSVNEKREKIGKIIVFNDITPEKEMEKIKNDFISMVTHDIKNPLNTIILNSTFLIEKNGKGKKENVEKFLKMINDSGKKILKLIDEFMNLSKIEAGIIKLKFQKTDFSHFLGEIIQNHARRAENKGIKIELNLPPEPVIFEFDQFQIERVCNNLLDNAIKFSQKGGTINIEITKDDSRVMTRVTDNGAGINKNEIPHLFEKYFRAKSSGNIKGTGLGLAIAKSIIEAHGGEIYVESRIAEGTTFLFYMPVKPEEAVMNIN